MEGYFDGWKLTEEQMHLINRRDGSAASKAAFEQFFNENYRRLTNLASVVLRYTFKCRETSYYKLNAYYKQCEIHLDKKSYNEFARKVLCAACAVTSENVIETADLLNSLYMDYLNGQIIFKSEPRYITGAVSRSFRYAIVGGLEGVKEYNPMGAREKCQKQASLQI